MELLILGVFAIPQIWFMGYLLTKLVGSIRSEQAMPIQLNKWIAFEILFLIVCPFLGTQLNGVYEPSGDLNPGSSMQFYPAPILHVILWVFIPSTVGYFLSKIFLIKYNSIAAAQTMHVCAVSILLISFLPMLYITFSGFILVALFPLIGLLVFAPLINVLLSIYSLKQLVALFPEQFQIKYRLVYFLAGVLPTVIALFWFGLNQEEFSSSLAKLF